MFSTSAFYCLPTWIHFSCVCLILFCRSIQIPASAVARSRRCCALWGMPVHPCEMHSLIGFSPIPPSPLLTWQLSRPQSPPLPWLRRLLLHRVRSHALSQIVWRVRKKLIGVEIETPLCMIDYTTKEYCAFVVLFFYYYLHLSPPMIDFSFSMPSSSFPYPPPPPLYFILTTQPKAYTSSSLLFCCLWQA